MSKKVFFGFIKKGHRKKTVLEQFLHGHPIGPREDDELHEIHRGLIGRYDMKKLHSAHFMALRSYTKEDHRAFNKALYRGDDLIGSHEELDKYISQALSQERYQAPHDFILHTGVKQDLREYPVEKKTGLIHVRTPAYTSTSFSREIAHEFAREHYDLTPDGLRTHMHVVHLHAPEGTHGYYMEGLTANENEHEFLLHKGAQWVLHPKPDIEKQGNVTTHFWHGKLIHDGIRPTIHHEEIFNEKI